MEDTYKRLLQFTRDGIYRYAFKDGTVLMANRGFVHILDLNCRPEDVVGKRLADLLIYVEKEGTMRNLLDKRGELHGFEYRFKTLKGEDKWVLHDSLIVQDPDTGEKVVEALVKDITDRKQGEQVLRESEEKYRNLVESARDGICIILDRKLEYANVQLAEMTGYTLQEMLGTAFTRYVDPAELGRINAVYEALLGGGAETTRVDTVLAHRDGRKIDAEISAGLITYNGRPAAMVVARNMTERKQWERALRDSGRKEAVGALAEGVAHNLSNIMGVIRGYALAIVDNVIPNTKAHEYTQRILDAAEHAVHVSRRLMAMAESSDAAGETQAQPVSLDEVIRDTLDMVEHAFGLQNVRVEVRNSGNLPRVSANAGQLLDVLMSVLMNSAEAMPRGGVVTLDAVERHVPRPPRANPKAAPGTYVALRVRDTGAGMKRGVARRVFEPFFSTKKEGASIGLGLTIAQSMMHGMGGWMDIRGREGAGCMARLFLRKAEAPAPAEAAPPPAAAGRAILLVDDRLEELTMMKEALAREGYTVHAAADAKSGAAMYRQNAERIALTVVDLLMPKAGGRHVLEEILRLDPQANVIVTSGFSRDFARGSLPAGGWRFLQKPFSPQRLVSRVNHLLRGTADSESE